VSLVVPRGQRNLRKHQHRLERPFEDVSDPLEPGAPTREDITAIIAFLRPHAGDRVLVHCEYGQSRSTAVALGAACMYGWNPAAAARDLSKLVVPTGAFYPNLLVLEHFDAELGLGGELVRVGSTWTLG
jgi:predicted protein tyrosine phosphatase